MIRCWMAAVAVVFAVSSVRAADASLAEGNWRLSQAMTGNEFALALLKVEKKDGKVTASVLEDAIKAEIKVGDPKVDGANVSIDVNIGGTKYTFEGSADPKDAKIIRGALFDSSRTFRAVLHSQAGEKIERVAPADLPKPPAPMAEANKLNQAPFVFRNQAQRSKDQNEKAELQAKAKAAQKEAEEKVPGLLREVVAKHGDSPFVVDAASQLLRGSNKNKATADELSAWVKILQGDADKFGPRIAHDTAITSGETLVRNKEGAALALPIAEKLIAGLKEKDSLGTQSRTLKLLLAAQKATSKTDAAIETRLAKVESALDDEYVKTVPPFKPETYSGRKDKDASRVVVMELFTGAQCPPCVAADVAFDALEKSYSAKDLILIQYHEHIPGPDPLTNAGTVSRMEFYSTKHPMKVRGTPSTLFNGKPDAGGGGGMANSKNKFEEYKRIIDGMLEEKTDVKVGGSAKLSGDKVNVELTVDGIKEPNDKLKLQVLLLEESIKYVGGNGLRFHHHVVRDMPAAIKIGEKSLKQSMAIDIAGVKSSLTKYLDEFAVDTPFPYLERPMDLKHLKVVALVQDEESGEILNAVQLDVK